MLNNKTVKELRTMAAEMDIEGRSKFKTKGEWIAAIEAVQVKEATEEIQVEENENAGEISYGESCEIIHKKEIEVVEQEVKPSKTRNNKRPLILYNEKDEVVEKFESQKEVVQYCLDNKLMNQGWVKTCVRDGRAAYYKVDGKKTTPSKKTGYTGIGYKVQYSI